MKTTLNLDDDLLAEARRLSQIEEKTALVHAGLRALIARESARRLAALGMLNPAIAFRHSVSDFGTYVGAMDLPLMMSSLPQNTAATCG